MRTLGIDYGERRIGVALSDPEGRFALPLEAIERHDDRSAIAALLRIVERESIESLVVGEPLRPSDGEPTDASRRARRFGERLGRATGLPVEWIDEAHSSLEAAERLRARGLPRRRQAPGVVDALSAQLLLQDALDRRAARPADS